MEKTDSSNEGKIEQKEPYKEAEHPIVIRSKEPYKEAEHPIVKRSDEKALEKSEEVEKRKFRLASAKGLVSDLNDKVKEGSLIREEFLERLRTMKEKEEGHFKEGYFKERKKKIEDFIKGDSSMPIKILGENKDDTNGGRDEKEAVEGKSFEVANKIKERQREILSERNKTKIELSAIIISQLRMLEKLLKEEYNVVEFNERINDLCEGQDSDIASKIRERQKEILDSWNMIKNAKSESVEEVRERKAAFEKAAQAIIEAETMLKKAEKNQKRFGDLFKMFRKKGSEEEGGKVSEELQHARDALQKAKDEYDSLTRQHMEEAFQDKAANEMEQKFNSIQAKMDAKMLLEDKRMQALEKDGGNAITRGFKKTLEGYRKLSFKQHLMIMGGLFLVSGTAPLVLSAALSGTVLSGVLVANRALSAIGGTATTEAMIDKRLKKHREKKGQTAEAQRKFAEEYVLQGVQGLDINTPEGKLAFLDKADREANDEINRRLSELRSIENKQNIAKWAVALGVGAFFALGGPEKIFKFGKEKIFGKKPIPAPEAPAKVPDPQAPQQPPVSKPSAPSYSTAPKPGPAPAIDANQVIPKTGPQVAPPGNIPSGVPSVPTPPGGGGLSGFVPELKSGGDIAEKIAEKSKEIISNARVAVKGDSIWKMAEKQSQSLFKGEPWFDKMDKIQQTHFLDSIKREALKLRGGKEFLRPGESVDFSFMRNLADKLKGNYVPGGRIAPGSSLHENIRETSGILRTWVKQNPGKTLTTDRAREIIQGVGKVVKSTKGSMNLKAATEGVGKVVEKAAETAGKPISYAAEQIPVSPSVRFAPDLPLPPDPEQAVQGVVKSAGNLKDIGILNNKVSQLTVNGLDKQVFKGITQKHMDYMGRQSAEAILKDGFPAGRRLSRSTWRKFHDAAKLLEDYKVPPNKGENFVDWVNRIRSKYGLKLFNK